MKIGIISDTHNQISLIQKALGVFKDEKVEMIIHAGDMDLANMLEEFKNIEAPIKMALGNIDQEPELFLEKAKNFGLDFVLNSFLDFNINGKSFYVFHGNVLGNLSNVIDILVSSKKYDVVIHGHTHRPRNEIIDGVLVLNPGSLQPLSVGVKPSIAIYDTDTGEARIVEL